MRALVLILLAGAMNAPGSTNPTDPPDTAAPHPGLLGREAAGSDTGLICVWAIHATVLQVGRQCSVSRSAAVETELARGVAAMEAYARRQSPQGAVVMDRYRATQIDHQAGLCHADPIEMYRQVSQVPPEVIRGETERLLATSPPVEWGTCL